MRPRRCRRIPAAADACQRGLPHQPGHALLANSQAFGTQFCADAGGAIGAMGSRMDRADPQGQIGIRRSPSRCWPFAPSIIAECRDLQDACHRADGINGLVHAHEPPDPFGLALLSRANQAAAPGSCPGHALPRYRAPATGGGFHYVVWIIPRARHWSCHPHASRRRGPLAEPTSRVTVRLARTLRRALPAFGPSEPNPPFDGEILTDKPAGIFA